MQRQWHDPTLAAYPRVVAVHLPSYPLKRGDLPLYVLGEWGGRLKALEAVERTGVSRAYLLPVRVIPHWHLNSLRGKFRTYHRGRKSAYIVDGAVEEVSLRRVLEGEVDLERRAEPRKMTAGERFSERNEDFTEEEKGWLRELLGK